MQKVKNFFPKVAHLDIMLKLHTDREAAILSSTIKISQQKKYNKNNERFFLINYKICAIFRYAIQ
jgi:hypothetical protein